MAKVDSKSTKNLVPNSTAVSHFKRLLSYDFMYGTSYISSTCTRNQVHFQHLSNDSRYYKFHTWELPQPIALWTPEHFSWFVFALFHCLLPFRDWDMPCRSRVACSFS
jgi:hypothetical protein